MTWGDEKRSYALAFDTANDTIAIGLGLLDAATRSISLVASAEAKAHRASNTQLLVRIDSLLKETGIEKESIGCIVCGRGPGSFTGVRIAMATAKGVASALSVPLVGVSTLDSIAWNLQAEGVRGQVAIIADAMRHEVYPVRYVIDEAGLERLDSDTVVKVEAGAENLQAGWRAEWIAGDALYKYSDLFAPCGPLVAEDLWAPTGRGLLKATEALWAESDILDSTAYAPGIALPVYTRLSDAEENERIRLSKNDPKNLSTGVQDAGIRRDQRPKAQDPAIENATADEQGIVYRPLDAGYAEEAAVMEQACMGSDAWSAASIADDLSRTDRVWWAAFRKVDGATAAEAAIADANDVGAGNAGTPDAAAAGLSGEARSSLPLVGYAGGWVVDGQMQILKVAVDPAYRSKGIARTLVGRMAGDARDLGARSCTLEVRASNTGAQAFYRALGLGELGTRPRYYSDREDAVIMEGPLPLFANDVAGMELRVDGTESNQLNQPLILAIETSCDETAAAIIDGEGTLLSDVVASQVDFHARFGGVVPEIASRKHIEAICGVAEEAFEAAARRLGVGSLGWHDLSASSVTYAPGLVGALVVGVAFAKGAAWGAGIPFIGVNHLEGHIYANKIETPDLAPPFVASLVSGGHTLLVHVKGWGEYETLGSSLDDAVGEAFDKVAKAMGLGYPGGPALSKLAEEGSPDAIAFPRAMLHSGDLRFSLSGLKTAVITYLRNTEAAGEVVNKADVAASFQQAVIDVQVAKAETALKQTGAKDFCLGGGVAANPELRKAYEAMCTRIGVRLTLPPFSACTDNASMIALVALDRYRQGKFFGLDADAHAHTNLDEPY